MAVQLRLRMLGAHQRPTDHATGSITTIEMGARPYVPSLGRFLSVDPIMGGSANDYDYTAGDPVNGFDLNGLKKKKQRPLPQDLHEPCVLYQGRERDVLFGTDICGHHSMAFYNKDNSIFWDFIEKDRRWDQPHGARNIDIKLAATGLLCVGGLATSPSIVAAGAAAAACTTSVGIYFPVERGAPEQLGVGGVAFGCALTLIRSGAAGLGSNAALCGAALGLEAL